MFVEGSTLKLVTNPQGFGERVEDGGKEIHVFQDPGSYVFKSTAPEMNTGAGCSQESDPEFTAARCSGAGITQLFIDLRPSGTRFSSREDVLGPRPVRTPMTILDGEGNSLIHGGLGNDTIDGGAGNDLIYGEAGRDTIRAGPGDDIVYARDGFADTISCGPGNDKVMNQDRSDRVAADCEVGHSGGGAPGVTLSVPGGQSLHDLLSLTGLRFSYRCSADCKIKVTLYLLSGRKRTAIGSTRTSVPGGQKIQASVAPTPAGARKLRGAHSARLVLHAHVTDAAGHGRNVDKKVTLH